MKLDTTGKPEPITCYDHRHRAEPAPTCHVCARLNVEADIVTRTVDALLAAGYALRADEREDPRPAQPTRDRAAILRELADVDDEFLAVWLADADPLDGLPCGWVRFVYGNDGYDVISDYTTNLEAAIAPVNAYADTLA